MDFDYWNEIFEPVTICDETGIILYMNQASINLFAKDDAKQLVGTNLLDCHPEPAKSMLSDMLENPRRNSYYILKNGIRKLIHQTPMYEDETFKGFIEISIPLETNVKEFIRK